MNSMRKTEPQSVEVLGEPFKCPVSGEKKP